MSELVTQYDLPAPVRRVLDWWLGQVRPVLGENLRSVLVGGGVALGDFQPRWSDVDICVVLEVPTDEVTDARLHVVHDQMRDRFIAGRAEGWQSFQAVEATYVPVLVAELPGAEAPCFVASGTTRVRQLRDPMAPFERLVFARRGVRYVGEPTDFRPPTTQQLRDDLRAHLRTIAHPSAGMRDSGLWLVSQIGWMARSTLFWRNEELVGKTPALERLAGAADDPGSRHYAAALNVRRQSPEVARAHAAELRASFDALASAADATLRQLAEIERT
jgi:hypothetical protein